MLISDFYDPAGAQAALEVVRRQRLETIAVQMCAPDELAPQLRGDLALHDVETGETRELTISPRALAITPAGTRSSCASWPVTAASAPSPASPSARTSRSRRSCCGCSARAASSAEAGAMELGGLARLTSGALSGTAAAAIGVAGAAAIIGLYLLRLRRRRVVVAFAPLWLGAAGAQRATRRARRLRHWLSLALALALFAALLIGAVDPGERAVDRQGRSLVLLIDRSASMSATDEPGSRLGAARRRAVEIARGLGGADRALVASFAADVTAESGFESDPRRLERAIAGVAPSAEPGDLPRALAFAGAILRGRPRPTVVLVSDGGFNDDDRRAAPVDPDGRALDVRYAPVGRRGDNVGILSLAARRIPADPGAVETALVVQSFRPRASTVGIEISSGGTPIDKVALTLGPGERRGLELPNLFAPDARVEARLTGGDDLPLDDQASATIPPLPRRRILRVGGADLYLDGALLGLGHTVHVDRLPAAEADRALDLAPNYDLVVFDNVTPSAPPARGRFLYLNPQGAGSPFAPAGAARPIQNPVLDPASLHRDHPLLRQLESERRQHHRLEPPGARPRRRRARRLVRRSVDRRPRASGPAGRGARLRPPALGPADAPRVSVAHRQRAHLGGARREQRRWRRARRRRGRHNAGGTRVGHRARPHARARRTRPLSA